MAAAGVDLPAVGSRWVHRKCKRVVKVDNVRASLASGNYVVEYHYVRTKGTMSRTKTGALPIQTMTLAQWQELFVEPTT